MVNVVKLSFFVSSMLIIGAFECVWKMRQIKSVQSALGYLKSTSVPRTTVFNALSHTFTISISSRLNAVALLELHWCDG